MIDYKQIKQKFIDTFGGNPRIFRAPGRVNLIGEHTDYNGGFVLPMAINFETAVAVAIRDDRRIRVHSVNLNESKEFDLDKTPKNQPMFWLNYIEGVAKLLERKGFPLSGADLLIWSDVPGGAGLSSSSALEIATGFALAQVNNHNISKVELAKIGQQTEHEFAGTNCGIMDQFVSANAIRNNALFLDCRNHKFENIPFQLENVSIVICDTNIKHNLASSEYNIRREECEKGVEILQQFLPNISQLRDVSVSDFEKYQKVLPEIIKRRVRHVVSENERTLKARKRLKRNEIVEFGELLWLSHASLRDDFDVSCKELNLLVEIAKDCQGVLGARMTGGGFGGSTVNFVNNDFLPEFTDKISRLYYSGTGIFPSILIVESNEGVSEVIADD